ncbi:MAG: hypothetical protein P4M15_05790 [Alphaproteobacteria bacterium]|nr:hypothetical protein [Alphaproteobacteria bacterium]
MTDQSIRTSAWNFIGSVGQAAAAGTYMTLKYGTRSVATLTNFLSPAIGAVAGLYIGVHEQLSDEQTNSLAKAGLVLAPLASLGINYGLARLEMTLERKFQNNFAQSSEFYSIATGLGIMWATANTAGLAAAEIFQGYGPTANLCGIGMGETLGVLIGISFAGQAIEKHFDAVADEVREKFIKQRPRFRVRSTAAAKPTRS